MLFTLIRFVSDRGMINPLKECVGMILRGNYLLSRDLTALLETWHKSHLSSALFWWRSNVGSVSTYTSVEKVWTFTLALQAASQPLSLLECGLRSNKIPQCNGRGRRSQASGCYPFQSHRLFYSKNNHGPGNRRVWNSPFVQAHQSSEG